MHVRVCGEREIHRHAWVILRRPTSGVPGRPAERGRRGCRTTGAPRWASTRPAGARRTARLRPASPAPGTPGGRAGNSVKDSLVVIRY